MSAVAVPTAEAFRDLAAPLRALDWTRIGADLDARGWATTGRLMSAGECEAVAALYAGAGRFRSRVVMQRHGYGQGEYQYFAQPLPAALAAARAALYEALAPAANRWAERLGAGRAFPATHAEFLAQCRAAGQHRPTPLLLRYGPGDYNRLHQDLYGEVHFPFQAVVLLSQPGRDFEGGEFVLTEQRARMQSRAAVVPLAQGEAVVFAVRDRPVESARGWARAVLRHGVSEVRAGGRATLGLVLHDAA